MSALLPHLFLNNTIKSHAGVHFLFYFWVRGVVVCPFYTSLDFTLQMENTREDVTNVGVCVSHVGGLKLAGISVTSRGLHMCRSKHYAICHKLESVADSQCLHAAVVLRSIMIGFYFLFHWSSLCVLLSEMEAGVVVSVSTQQQRSWTTGDPGYGRCSYVFYLYQCVKKRKVLMRLWSRLMSVMITNWSHQVN